MNPLNKIPFDRKVPASAKNKAAASHWDLAQHNMPFQSLNKAQAK
jgi:hypothetical protein